MTTKMTAENNDSHSIYVKYAPRKSSKALFSFEFDNASFLPRSPFRIAAALLIYSCPLYHLIRFFLLHLSHALSNLSDCNCRVAKRVKSESIWITTQPNSAHQQLRCIFKCSSLLFSCWIDSCWLFSYSDFIFHSFFLFLCFYCSWRSCERNAS